MGRTTIRNTVNRKVARDYLSAQEVSLLLEHAKKTRYGKRDCALILLTFRHGLRATEAVEMRWSQIDLRGARIEVKRLKGSDDSIHVLEPDEARLLRDLQKAQPDSDFVFLSERGAPMTADNFLKLVKRLGKAAKLPFNVHPHMLRHGCGFQLTMGNQSTRTIQQYLGHRNIQHTVRYTKMTNEVFKNFGKVIGGKLK